MAAACCSPAVAVRGLLLPVAVVRRHQYPTVVAVEVVAPLRLPVKPVKEQKWQLGVNTMHMGCTRSPSSSQHQLLAPQGHASQCGAQWWWDEHAWYAPLAHRTAKLGRNATQRNNRVCTRQAAADAGSAVVMEPSHVLYSLDTFSLVVVIDHH